MQRGVIFAVLAVVLPLLSFQAGRAGDKRQPIPDKASQAKIMALIDELYKGEMVKAAKDPLALSRLASLFLQEARDTTDNAAGRYLLLVLAADYAAKAGDAPVALQAIEEKAQYFQVPAAEILEAKIAALFSASKSSSGADAYQTVLDSSLVLLEDALANDDFPASVKLIGAAEAAAIKLRSLPLLSSVRRRQAEIKRLQTEFAEWKPFADRLAKNADDAEANARMGAYQAFVKGDWERGLPLLAKGDDKNIRSIARLDIAEPKDAKGRLALATAWERQAKSLRESMRTHVLLRAYHWYQEALADLAPAKRAEIEKTMAGIMEAVPQEYRVGEIAQELRKCEGSIGPVYAASFSPRGKKIVSGGADGAVHIWDVRTGKELRRLDGHTGRVWTVAFAPDGRRVLSGGFDNTLRLWDLASGREMRRFDGHADYVRSAVFSRDGALILSGGDDRTLRLWSVETGSELQAFKGHDHFVWSVDLSRDGTRALSGSLDKTVRLWDVKTGKVIHVLKGHRDTVLSVAFSPDGRRALSGSTDKTVIVWDLDKGEPLHVLKGHSGYVHAVAFAPDGRRALSAGQDHTLRLWDVYEGSELKTLPGHTDQIWSTAYSPDGRLALTCGQDGTIRIWSGAK